MQIANPIYDVVFKYLFDDIKVAKLLISKIIGKKISSINLLPFELIAELQPRLYTVFRLHFSARVKAADGYENTLIEIQKAKFVTDIMRFRKILGENYQDQLDIYKRLIFGKETKNPIPIITIYFLGHKLEHITVPIIKVQRHYYDVTTAEKIKQREEFIESLTHDSFIIQIPYLRQKYETEVEQLLSVFDQQNVSPDDHILNVREEDFPAKCRPLIHRLLRAFAEPQVRDTMDIEDEILEYFQYLEREIAKQDQAIEAIDRKIEEKDKTIEEQDKIILEKDREIEEFKKKLEMQEVSCLEIM